MYDRILVPVDEGRLSLNAIDEVVRIAGTESEIHGLYVSRAEIEQEESVKSFSRLGEFEEAIEERLGTSPITAVRRGSPTEEIVAYAKEHDIEVIVMGTHARDGLEHLLYGSVTEDTLHEAVCPVLAVPPREDEDED